MVRVCPPTEGKPVIVIVAVFAASATTPAANFGVGNAVPISAGVSHKRRIPELFCKQSAIACCTGATTAMFSCHLVRVT